MARRYKLQVALGGCLLFASHALAAPSLLYAPVKEVTIQPRSLGPEVIRTRQVFVEIEILSNVSNSPEPNPAVIVVEIELFDGNRVTAELVRGSSGLVGMQAWIGKIPGDEGGSITLVINGEIAQGNIQSSNFGLYQLRYLSHAGSRSLHELREVDPDRFPGEHPPE